MIKGIKASKIYVYNQGIIDTAILINDAKIVEINEKLDTTDFIVIPNNLYVVPGFVDKHIHGAYNSDFMNPTIQDLDNITTAIAKEGTTSCLATTMTQNNEAINKALKNIADYIDNHNGNVEILGIHLEGPFISSKFAGAQPKEYIIPCSIEKFKEFNEIARGYIKQVSYAPEENGLEFTKYLKENNIVASFGHTNSSYDIAYEAINLGATSSTHTYNAMKGIHHRDIGVLGAAIIDHRINSEIICDLIHVSPAAIKLLYKNKGIDNISLITDSMEAKYMPDGTYLLGGQDVFVKDNQARLADGTLAGSILKLNDAIRNFKNTCGVSFTEAIDCATINPARCLNIDNRKGSIEIGKDADFTIVDDNFNVYMTICRGKIIYSIL